MTEPTCAVVRESQAELALGVLEGRERAEVLAHLEHCAACRQDLAALSAVADRLVELTPSVEPPAGFETRVLARLSAAKAEEPVGRRGPAPPAADRGLTARAGRRRWPLPKPARWVAAAALAAVIGAGGWAIGHEASAPSAAQAAGHEKAAPFVAGDRTVGQVVAYDGPKPWVSMSVDENLGDRTVKCQLVERNGTISTVGTFQLSDGYGYWGAAIGVPPSSIARVQLVDAAGRTVAAAVFATADVSS
jgi:hypothetical protein